MKAHYVIENICHIRLQNLENVEIFAKNFSIIV